MQSPRLQTVAAVLYTYVWNKKWLGPASALTLALPFVHYGLGWLSVVCLVPFLYYLESKRQASTKHFVSSIWSVGLLFFAIVLSWILFTRADEWGVLVGWQAALGVAIVYFILVFGFSLQFIVFALLYKKLNVSLLKPISFLLLSALWVVSEAFRSFIFSVISYGSEGTIGLFWNFGSLGVAGAATPLAYIARFAGMFGLSFVIVAINLGLYWVLHKKYRLPLVIFAAIIILSFSGWVVYKNPTGPTMQATVVQLESSNSLQSAQEVFQQDLLATLQTQDVAKSSIDILVLPEYADFYREEEKSLATQITNDYLSQDGVVVSSVDRDVLEESANEAVIYSRDANEIASQKKQFLIPVGEFMPYIISATLKLIGLGGSVESYVGSTKGDTAIQPFVVGSQKLGALICSGAIAPELYRGLAKNGATVLSNSASLSIFSRSYLYHQQARQMTQLSTIANARPFLQSSTGSYSYILDSNGRSLAETHKQGFALLRADVATNTTRTVYTLLGEWTVVFSGLVIVVIAVWHRKKN